MQNARVPADSPEIRNLDGQIGQAESQNRWADAVRLLRTRAQRVAPAQEQVRTLEHLVSVFRVKLGDERGATQAAEEVLRVDPSHAAARQYLAESYARTGDQAKLQALRASAPAQPSGGGGIMGAITGAVGSAVSAVGVAATGFASAVEESNKNPDWMRQGGAPGAPQPKPAAPARAAAPRCPYCGADTAAGAKSCTACGASF